METVKKPTAKYRSPTWMSIDLEDLCSDCYAKEDKCKACMWCKGVGFIPTLAGKQLLLFLKRHEKYEVLES